MSSPSLQAPSVGVLQRKLASAWKFVVFHYEKNAWLANETFSKLVGRTRGLSSDKSRAFDSLPLMLGNLQPATLTTLQDAIFSAPQAEFNPSDHAAGYVFNPDDAAMAKIFNAGYRFRKISTQQLRAISDLLQELSPTITAHLGSGWKVINLKSWSVRSDTVQQGPNAWHLDGFPRGTFKLMVYLTPIGVSTGTTEVRFSDGSSHALEGEAGTYLLFDPSVLWHRGLAPDQPGVERTHIEISLMRAAGLDSRIVEGGLNSAYPRLPWTPLPIRHA